MSDRRIYQDITRKLAERINNGELPDGARLPPERELAETFGVSRTSIREALLLLQAQGLVLARKRTRARVTQLNNPGFLNQLSGAAQTLLAQPNGMANFQEARVLFECGLVRYAARHASPKEIERLNIALSHNKKAIGSPKLFAKTDVAFHDILAEIPHNPIFIALNKAFSEWLLSQRTVVLGSPIRGIARRAYLGHKQIYEAVAAHDAELADRVMADHLKTISETYWKGIAAKAT